MTEFVKDPSKSITCTKVVVPNAPSTRWGHGSAVQNSTHLYIMGGRNENDVSDI